MGTQHIYANKKQDTIIIHKFEGPFTTKSQRDLARRRVNRGVEALNLRFGLDWPLEVSMKNGDLDLSSAERCVLGQLAPMIVATLTPDKTNKYYEYINALEAMGWDSRTGVLHGFDTSDDGKLKYEQLQWTWEMTLGRLQRERLAARETAYRVAGAALEAAREDSVRLLRTH